MDLEQFYLSIGGNYSEVLSRLSKEERIRKYLHIFTNEDEFIKVEDALRAGDAELAFRTCHSLKGMCLNLGLDELLVKVSAITEKLRPLTIPSDINEYLEDFRDSYYFNIDLIKSLDK
ncbi:MAG: Hpt domain-containing protein [Lachnospiraceae bacterium]|nr:Hpt domain-containing protein [Lachnospiraceae bacterium]